VLVALALAACAPRTSVERGEQLFSDASLAGSDVNRASCATCHATDALPSDRMPPGGTLRGVMGRPTYWGGIVVEPRDAVNACLYYFMRASERERLGVTDPRGEDLLAYLDTLGTMPSSAVPFTVPTTLPTMLPAGDATRGATVYARACRACHGDSHTGAGHLTPLAVVIPDSTNAEHGMFARSVAIAKIRHGGFFGIGGSMPPFSIETLDDQGVADVLAYLAF
jgi:thiosulfate dehydrogenase